MTFGSGGRERLPLVARIPQVIRVPVSGDSTGTSRAKASDAVAPLPSRVEVNPRQKVRKDQETTKL